MKGILNATGVIAGAVEEAGTELAKHVGKIAVALVIGLLHEHLPVTLTVLGILLCVGVARGVRRLL